jgi:capsule polysaccharide export protein KpsE/RkpR
MQIIARLRALWEARKILLCCFFVGGALSLVWALSIPSRYDATAQLMPPEGQSGAGLAALSALSGHAGSLGGFAGELLGVRNSGALFVGILLSRTVQDRLIERFNLRRLYHAARMEDARGALAAHSRIVEDHKSGIISITVMDHDPQLAAVIAQAYVNELDRLVEQVSTSSARRERIFLEERLRAVKQDLDSAAQKFSEFASKNIAIDIPAQSKAMLEAAATLEGQRIAAEAELHGLEQMYTEQNVRVRALRARVAELRTQLNKMGGVSGPSDAPSPDKEASSYPAIRQLPILGVTYADLYRQTKIQETVYELLTQQYELAKVEEAKEVPSVKVLDAPAVPTKKSFPPRGLLTVAGTCFAFFGACGWILARHAWQHIDPQDPGKQFALEIAGTLRADALRIVPAPALRQMLAKLRVLFEKRVREQAAAAETTEQSVDGANLTRAARNSLG